MCSCARVRSGWVQDHDFVPDFDSSLPRLQATRKTYPLLAMKLISASCLDLLLAIKSSNETGTTPCSCCSVF